MRRNHAGVVVGNVFDKEGTKNPIARALLRGFDRAFAELSQCADGADVLEVGCGEGLLSRRVAPLASRFRGCDIDASLLNDARRRCPTGDFFLSAIEDLSTETHACDVVICCEVLEHVADPRLALAAICRLARHQVLLSVPREPIWRALNMVRGRYLRDLGNTPGHLHHFSRRQFVVMLKEQVEILAIRTPLPWTMVLAKPHPAGAPA